MDFLEIDGIKYWISIITTEQNGTIIDSENFKTFDDANLYLAKIHNSAEKADIDLHYTLCEDCDGTPMGFSWSIIIDFDKFTDEKIEEIIVWQREFIEEAKEESLKLEQYEKEIHYQEFTGDHESKKAHFSEIMYVCPTCLNEVEHCTCPLYPYYLVQIDREMISIISELNYKGYKTRGCCAGHPKDKNSIEIYISFDKDYSFDEPFPEGVRYSKLSHSLHLPFPEGASLEEREKWHFENLDKLLYWAEMLNDLNNNFDYFEDEDDEIDYFSDI